MPCQLLSFAAHVQDLSCEMVFGAKPPAIEDDPVYTQPCFPHICKLGNTEAKMPCPKVDTSVSPHKRQARISKA